MTMMNLADVVCSPPGLDDEYCPPDLYNSFYLLSVSVSEWCESADVESMAHGRGVTGDSMMVPVATSLRRSVGRSHKLVAPSPDLFCPRFASASTLGTYFCLLCNHCCINRLKFAISLESCEGAVSPVRGRSLDVTMPGETPEKGDKGEFRVHRN